MKNLIEMPSPMRENSAYCDIDRHIRKPCATFENLERFVNDMNH